MNEYLGNAFTGEQQADPETAMTELSTICFGIYTSTHLCNCDNHSGGCTYSHLCDGYRQGGPRPEPMR